jgi:DNA-binding CsgD family transcriptional regulator
MTHPDSAARPDPPRPADDADLRARLGVTALLAAVAIGGAADLALDSRESVSPFHVAFEVSLLALSLAAIAMLWIRWARTRRALADSHGAERDAWRTRVEALLRGLGEAIDAQLARGQLTPAERETALLLLEGYGHKEIAALLGKSEPTVHQQSVAVYRKSGRAGRAALSAFFLEDPAAPGARSRRRGDRSMTRCLVVALAALLAIQASAATEASREDLGDLIVLHLAGSYEEMGRQQAELLGPVLRDVYAFNRADYDASVAELGLSQRAFEPIVLPLASGLADDASGFAATIRGIAAVLDVAPREVLRASFALDAGSTVFVATRAATADGGALIGRNVDWGDAGGRRRPVVAHLRPDNGDLAHISVAWPLMHLPTVGLNEAGFAISLNYFDTEPLVTLMRPEWPQRRALQIARNVEDGIRTFLETRRLGAANYVAMADASGAIALLECRPGTDCVVFRPAGDWFAHANHARSAAMIPFDRYRSPDSFGRQRDMEHAVERHLGAITPARAAEILRDRTGHAFPNATSVGNLFVLNAAVVQPATGLLWHATTRQPHAPFGDYVAFSPRGDANGAPPLPASPVLGTEAFAAERDAIAEARRAVDAQRRGRAAEAREIWDALATQDPPRLDPARIAVARAHALHALGEDAAAFAALAAAEDTAAPYDARAYGLAQRAWLADRLARRDEALRLWNALLAHLEAGPEYNAFEKLRALAVAGRAAPAAQGELPMSWWDVGVSR